MGQIVGGAAKPKRCNLNKLSQLGTPAAGEYILVSSDNSMNASGQGNFDCYIVGDGTKAATALPLIKTYANDVDDEPTAGSQNLVYSGGVLRNSFQNQFIGKANTLSRSTINTILPDHKYRVWLEKTNWDRNGIPFNVGNVFFNVAYSLSGTVTDLIKVVTGDVIKSYYDFTAPNSFDYFLIGGKAATDVVVRFNIEDITYLSAVDSVASAEAAYNGSCVLANGTVLNYSNQYCIRTSWIAVNDAKYVAVITNRPPTQGYSYYYGSIMTTDASDIGKTNHVAAHEIGSIDASFSEQSRNGFRRDISSYPTAVGIAFVLVEKDENGNNHAIRVSDFDGYWVRIINSRSLEEFAPFDVDGCQARIADVEEKFEDYETFYPLPAASNISIRNGSQGNGANAWVVTLVGNPTLAIPVVAGHKYKVFIDYPLVEGFHYYYRLVTYSTSSPSTLVSSKVRDWTGRTPLSIDTPIEINDGELGMSIQVTELTSPSGGQNDNECVKLRNTALTGHVSIRDVTTTLAELENRVGGIESSTQDNIVNRNKDKCPMLINACRYRKTGSSFKDYQVVICTDMHAADVANKNAIKAANGFETIDSYINAGDIVASNYNEPSVRSTFATDFAKLTKPGYVVCGNHDVGNTYYVALACNHAQAYNSFIKPMVDKGFLVSGEYEVGNPYWYHDDATHKIRIIGLYEYDDNLDFNETYWKTIEYDGSLPAIAYNTSYSVGAKVNAGSYNEHSFECVQAVTTPANYYTSPSKLPSYKVLRGTRVIRETQAQWFLDVLASTPANYGVLVIMHNPFSLGATSLDKKFSWPADQSGGSSSWTQNSMVNDFIRDAVVAFVEGANYSDKIIMKNEAAYMNVLNDGVIEYAYQVSKNFSSKNAGVYLLGFIGGHAHRDFIWKDATKNIYQVAPNCARVDGLTDRNGDVRRSWVDSLSYDSLTVASFASGRIGLVKLGVNVTERGTFRDYEVIDTTD